MTCRLVAKNDKYFTKSVTAPHYEVHFFTCGKLAFVSKGDKSGRKLVEQKLHFALIALAADKT